jgi:kinesin family protein C1
VDLAGSERVKKSEVEGIHMKEAQCMYLLLFVEHLYINTIPAINKSLAALGNVVNGLFMDKKHVPFRDSKLTRILKPSFVGRGKVLLIANLSPTVNSAQEVCVPVYNFHLKNLTQKFNSLSQH